MMIARRRMIESLSKVARWIYKAGNAKFFEGSEAGENEGLSFSAPSGQRLVLSAYTLNWVTITVPGGGQTHHSKDIGGYVNIGDTLATGSLRPYNFAPYKQLVIEVESGKGIIGYGANQVSISKRDDKHVINPSVKLQINGGGKYIMDISNVSSANYICVGTSQYAYGSPRLIVSNIYFK